MSILIKGVDMPENCHECEFVDILPTCPCNKMSVEDFWKNVSLAVEGHKDCPLVPVPPHGRLGDLDKLESGLRHMAKYQHGDRQQGILGCCETIRLAPTIIEAEDGE